MKAFFAAAISFFCFIPFQVHANDKAILDEAKNKIIQLADLLKDEYAEEYAEARGIQLFHDKESGKVVVVSVFTIEGFGRGNNYFQFMGVFTTLNDVMDDLPSRLTLVDVKSVGGKGLRLLEFDNIKIEKYKGDVLITVPTKEYGPNDGMCCPSKDSEVKFVIGPYLGGRLAQID